MATITVQILCLFLIIHLTSTGQILAFENCTGSPSPNATQNLLPIYKGDPVFIRQVKNAKLYSVGLGQDAIFIVHLWGTPYEMGYAHGAIMKDKATQFIETVWEYIENQAKSSTNFFKPWFRRDIADFGLKLALDLHLRETRKHTPEYFFDEIRGLSNATGIKYQKILRVHMISEIFDNPPKYLDCLLESIKEETIILCLLSQGEGSLFGAWGDSVKTKESLLHLRALDWTTSGPFQDFPQITVYHPDVFKGYPFVNIGWSGWIGSLTGFNVWKISTSEISVSFPDSSFGKQKLHGIPFAFMLRDIIQWDQTIPKVMTRLNNVTRTGNLILGVGDGWRHQFIGVQYTAQQARFFNDSNNEPEASWHPRLKDTVYYGGDGLCPSYSQVLSQQLITHYGELAADVVIRDVIPIEQSGSLQVAIYDLFNDYVYIANARGSADTGPLNAYERTFVRLNGTKLFYEGNPSFRRN